jgi:outer membrane protein assembly factor BamB
MASFGPKGELPVMGRVYGHPLYVPNLMVMGSKHNTVFVGTESNYVHAFDADTQMQLWQKMLEPAWTPGQGGFTPGCGDMQGQPVGITGTPVISLEENKIYVAAKTAMSYQLHALDLSTGMDAPGSPVGIGGAGFSSPVQLNRPGLLYLNNTGMVYIAFGSHCDGGPYHGWVFGYDAKTLMLKATFNSGGAQGAIWMSGTGPSSDGMSVWVAVGNGSMYANNAVKMNAMNLMVTAHHQEPVAGDNDLVTGVILVGNQALIGGKSGQISLINQSDGTLAQTLKAGGETHNIATWAGPNGTMAYTCDTGASPHAWLISGGMLVDKGTNAGIHTAHPGGMITTSSNGTMAGTAIAWVSAPNADAWHQTAPGTLYALDASDITKPALWSSATIPTWAKFSPPIVANGRVYQATFDNKVLVFGLLH